MHTPLGNKKDRYGDMVWIFRNGKRVIDREYEESLIRLGKDLDIEIQPHKSFELNDPTSGDNWIKKKIVLEHSESFLEKNDINGWKMYCECIKYIKKKENKWYRKTYRYVLLLLSMLKARIRKRDIVLLICLALSISFNIIVKLFYR